MTKKLGLFVNWELCRLRLMRFQEHLNKSLSVFLLNPGLIEVQVQGEVQGFEEIVSLHVSWNIN